MNYVSLHSILAFTPARYGSSAVTPFDIPYDAPMVIDLANILKDTSIVSFPGVFCLARKDYKHCKTE